MSHSFGVLVEISSGETPSESDIVHTARQLFASGLYYTRCLLLLIWMNP